jgi:hypothetical protein
VPAIEEAPPLNVENYPAVKFWYKKQRGKKVVRCQKLAQQNCGGGSSTRASQEENVWFWFIQNVDGMVVDSDIISSVCNTARLIWAGMSDEYGSMGLPWSSIPAKCCLEFWLKLEWAYPFLHLCANHYKADAVATEDYTHRYKAQGCKQRHATKSVRRQQGQVQQ